MLVVSDMKNFKGLVPVSDVIEAQNFSRLHMDQLIDKGVVNVAVCDGIQYMTDAECERFSVMLAEEKQSLTEMFVQQDEIRERVAAEVAELFNN